jgi:hypothetical protein
MPPSRKSRAERRAAGRQLAKDLRQRERLAFLEVGGAPERPIEVVSASVVEPKARSMPCPLCGAAIRIDEHAARVVDDVPLRLVRVSCPMCGHDRVVHFVIVPALPN